MQRFCVNRLHTTVPKRPVLSALALIFSATACGDSETNTATMPGTTAPGPLATVPSAESTATPGADTSAVPGASSEPATPVVPAGGTSPVAPSVPTQPMATVGEQAGPASSASVPAPAQPDAVPIPSASGTVAAEPVGTTPQTSEPAEPGVESYTCSFDVQGDVSSAISTVGIINWSTDATGVTAAHIEFGLQGAETTLVAPVEPPDGQHRTLLLGMKGSSTYAYRIVVEAGAQTCTSEDYTIETGPVVNALRPLTIEVSNPDAIAPGFIVLSDGIGNGGGGGGGGGNGGGMMYIVDQDGDPVWWADAPNSTSRARMDWEGNNMWMLSLNVGNSGGGAMRRVSMDGLDVEENVDGLSDIHHDFCVLPGGIVAGPSWSTGGNDPPSNLIERAPDGTITTIAEIGPNIYTSNSYHTNSIHYHPTDDAYTISDRNPNLYVKVSRQGQVLWQLGGSNPVGAMLTGDTTWSVNHGHHLTEDGHFLLFNNNGRGGGGGGGGGASLVLEYILDEDANTAELIWEYDSGVGSATLGDVQRLPNGNTLVTYSNAGTIHEVGPDQQLVRTIEAAASFGYAIHRPTLYGPPPKSR